jgi:FkbM family methyltransferase
MRLPKLLDDFVRTFLERRGYILLRGQVQDKSALARRKSLIVSNDIDLVIDVGANTGQYGRGLRRLGYTGRIVSLEPMTQVFFALQDEADKDSNWTAINMGLGDQPGKLKLHISENSISSSLLEMMPTHEHYAPKSIYVREEIIEVSTLNILFSEVRGTANKIWLKLDVQGFEDRVLNGATTALASIDFVQTELSLIPLYDSQMTYLPLCALLDRLGFDLIGLEPGFVDPKTGTLLQFDGIFRKRKQDNA